MLRFVALTFALCVAAGAETDGPITLDDATIAKFLERHNTHRNTVSSPALAWNASLAEFAASQTPMSKCTFKHAANNAFGENLFARWGYSTEPTSVAKAAVDAWFSEVNSYPGQDLKTNWYSLCFPYPKPEGHKDCGHYTQVVWKSTQSVGCAIMSCDSNWRFVACEYYPPGNMQGQNAW